MKIGNIVKNFKRVLDSNAPVILTGIAVSGACLTTYLSARGAYKAANVVRGEQDLKPAKQLSTQEKFLMTYKFYAPAAVSLVGTSACMVMATKIGLDRTAAVAGAFVIAERANDQYRDKVKELLGENKHTKVVDAVNKEKVESVTIPQTLVVPEGQQIFIDSWSGRAFPSTTETIKQAVNQVNHNLLSDGYASLSEFYGAIGLDNTTESDNIGWDSDHLIELVFTPTLKDERAVVAFSFEMNPRSGFQDAHS